MKGGDSDSFRGKVFLLTGSGQGLGAALARAAAERQARVVVNCRANLRRAEGVAAEIRRGGGEAIAFRADVADHQQARALVDETLRAFSRIDVLVNSVGGFSWKPLAEMEPGEWRATMASNLDSVYNMCRLAVPSMRRNHWGRIVNMGAVGAERAFGQAQASAYSAAKAAVVAFSKALALEEARCGITVNVVAPGVLRDEEDEAPAPTPAPEHPNHRLGDRVPMGRAGAQEDVVRSVLFFVSPAAEFLTGQVLSVAGGWRL